VVGKASVLAILLSQITWIPGLILFAVQASQAGAAWTWNHLWIAGSLLLSSWIWIAMLSLLAMALSAWVRWRIVAGALLLAVLFFGAGFAQAINAVMRTQSGHFLNLFYLVSTVWTSLFRIDSDRAISSGAAWIALLTYCGACLALLVRKVQAYEVVD
jgi:ABC-2 type transport system permease protein